MPRFAEPPGFGGRLLPRPRAAPPPPPLAALRDANPKVNTYQTESEGSAEGYQAGQKIQIDAALEAGTGNQKCIEEGGA